MSEWEREREMRTVVRFAADVPQLAEEDAALLMNSIHYWFPRCHLIVIPDSRGIRVPTGYQKNNDFCFPFFG